MKTINVWLLIDIKTAWLISYVLFYFKNNCLLTNIWFLLIYSANRGIHRTWYYTVYVLLSFIFAEVYDLFRVEANLSNFGIVCLYQYCCWRSCDQKGEVWDLINRFNTDTWVSLIHTNTWVFICICLGIFVFNSLKWDVVVSFVDFVWI